MDRDMTAGMDAQQTSTPIEYHIHQLLLQISGIESNGDLDPDVALKRLSYNIKHDLTWKRAFLNLIVEKVGIVVAGRVPSANCLRDRAKEVRMMLDVAINARLTN